MDGKYPMTGMSHRGTEAEVNAIPPGDPMTLEREPGNQYDPNAIRVLHRSKHVAYIKSNVAKSLAPTMDAAGVSEVVGKFSFNTHPCVIIGELAPKEDK